MRREIVGPFCSEYFEAVEAERVGKGDVRLERGSGSFALSLTDLGPMPPAAPVLVNEWRIRVQVRLPDQGAGLTDLGWIRTVPPSKGAPPSRIVAFISVPGAVGFNCDFFCSTPNAVGTVGFGECPFIGELGLVPSQFADRETDRYTATGGVLAAGVASVSLATIGGGLGRAWSICVYQVGVGGLVSAPYPYGGTSLGTVIPIAPDGALNLHPGGGLVLPITFDVNMPAGGGGWFAEWGE